MQLVKIYERGSMAEAEVEAGIGQMLEIEGIVRYHTALRDPATSRPCVILDYHPGLDLAHWIARRGPLEPGLAARVGLRIARPLVELHAFRAPEVPRGVVHRDIKPANIYLVGDEVDPAHAHVLLLDLEHALPAADDRNPDDAGRFTGGTHGFAPPEAYAGAPPTAAFDVFGFGATMHTALAGRPPFLVRDNEQIARAVTRDQRPRWPLLGLPRRLRDLIEACLASDPAARPTMVTVRDALTDYLATHDTGDHNLNRVQTALHRGDLEGAEAELAAPGEVADAPRVAELTDLLRRRGRLLQRYPPSSAAWATAATTLQRAARVATTAPATAQWLERFPAAPALLERRRDLERELTDVLEAAPREVADHKRSATFDDAEALLEETLRAVQAASRLPVANTATAKPAASQVPGPMQRDPRRYLELALKDVRDAARTHAVMLGKLHIAEQKLDLGEAEAVLESTSSLYSGATDVVAGLKDRSHRFGFYLERIAKPAPVLDILQEQLLAAGVEHDLSPVESFQKRCAVSLGVRRYDAVDRRHDSLRGFHRTLHDLVAEFPHAAPAATDAVEVLDSAFESLTDACWELLEDGHRKLVAVPIPIRPLQSIVNRIDTLRRLEVLVDLPKRTRAQLLDEHERLRIKVDQARMTRDQIARGAEEAMQKGHLTTALFDMERAVDQYSGETDELEAGSRRLVAQLEEAKRKKAAIEAAGARNIELAARQAELLDDADSSHSEQLEVLEQRKQVLLYLTHNLQQGRVSAYESDLADVEMEILDAHCENASVLLERTTDPAEQERIAHSTFDCISTIVREQTVALPGRARSLVEHWEEHLARIREVREDRAAAALSARVRRRRRRVLVAAPALGILILGGLFATGLLGGDAIGRLDAAVDSALRAPIVRGDAPFDGDGAGIALDDFVQRMADSAPPERYIETAGAITAARKLVAVVRVGIGPGPGYVAATWPRDFADAVREYDAAITATALELTANRAGHAVADHLRRFGAHAQAAGLLGVGGHAGSEAVRDLLRELADIREITLPEPVRARLTSG